MKTEWLEWLILFKQYESLQKVSDICHVTPQNIGKMFNNLEEEMGLKLFSKKGNKLRLTEAGVELAAKSEMIINTLEEVKQKYNNTHNLLTGKVEIIGANRQMIQSILKSFVLRYPNIEVTYMEMDIRAVLEYIKDDVNAMAIMPIWHNASFHSLLKKYESSCQIHLLFKDEQRVFVSKNSDLAEKKHINIQNLKGKKVVMYTRNGRAEEAKFIFNNFILNNAAYELDIIGTNSPEYFLTLVEQNLAVGMALCSAFPNIEQDKNIKAIKIDEIEEENITTCVWGLVYNVKKKFTACDKAMLSVIEKYNPR